MRDLSDQTLGQMFQLDDGPGPARPVDDALAAALIAGALGGAGFPPPAGPRAGGPDAGGPGAGHAAAAAATKGVAIGKLALIAGGAVAVALGTWVALRAPGDSRALVRAPAPAIVAPGVPAPSEPPPAEPPVAEPPPSPPPAEPTVAEPPVEISVPPVSEPPPRRPKPGKPGAGHAHAPRPAAPTIAIAPEDLLASANAARASHHWRTADALYARVVAGPHADLAVQAALVASASIHLEHLGDPAGAIRRFRAALAAGPGDALAEDARWGLAESTRATGDRAAEAAALDDFLAHHAGSPRAARARARRGELEAQP